MTDREFEIACAAFLAELNDGRETLYFSEEDALRAAFAAVEEYRAAADDDY